MKKNYLLFALILLFSTYSFAQNSEGNGGEKKSFSPKDTPASLPFFDNFDDGDLTDYDDLGGTTTTEVSVAQSVFGGHSLHIDGGTFGSGLSRTLNAWPTYISASIMTPTTLTSGASTYIDLYTTDDDIVFSAAIDDAEGVAIWNTNTNGWSGLGTHTGGTWYFVEFKLDYVAETIDFVVNNILIGTFPFRNSVTTDNCILTFHNYSNSEGYWDEIYAYADKDVAAPTITNLTDVCPNTTQTLTASTTVEWWNAAVDGDFIGLTSDLDVMVGKNDTSLYANSIVIAANHIGSQISTYSGNVRGYYFTAPTDFIITAIFVPMQISGTQDIEIVRFTNGVPPEYSSGNTSNDFVSLGFWEEVPEYELTFCHIPVSQGDIIGIYGYRGQENSYSEPQYQTHIFDMPVTLIRSGMQSILGGGTGNQMHDIFKVEDGKIGNIQFAYNLAESERVEGSIIMEDEQPTLVCPANISVDAGNTHTYAIIDDSFDATDVLDNCEVDYVYNNYNSLETLNGITLPEGTTTITWNVVDIVGNTNSCSFDITVNEFVGIEDLVGDVNIYPNPSNGLFTVENARGFNVVISDISGKVIREFNNVSDNNLNIDFTDQATGIYFVKISSDSEVKTIKLVVK